MVFFFKFEVISQLAVHSCQLHFRLEQLNLGVNPCLRTERHMFCISFALH